PHVPAPKLDRHAAAGHSDINQNGCCAGAARQDARMNAMPLDIVVFYGSVRSARQGIKAARFIAARCRARGHSVHLVDPLDHPLPLLDRMYKEYRAGEAPDVLQGLADIVAPADGYIVVSGEYNHTVPPALSNLM